MVYHQKKFQVFDCSPNQSRTCKREFFPQLHDHMYDHEILTEDLHSSQLLKKIIDKYVGLRLITYGKHYTKDILNKDKIGVRQQSTKMVLFTGV